MVYIFFSDIHANLYAWQSAKRKLLALKPDKIVYLGDIVGYGPRPQECWEELMQVNSVLVGGNHDWAAGGRISKENFSFLARTAIEWTETKLNVAIKEKLGRLELVWQGENLRAVHSSLFCPADFLYLDNRYILEENFQLMGESEICFVGHTHIPAVFTLRPRQIEYRRGVGKIKLQQRLKHIVNVGSIGQPRDRDPRGCMCLYDSKRREVEFVRIAYDVKKTQREILHAGLPELLAARLEKGW